VCIATPRKDVVLELQPRLAKAFSGHSVVTLYGGSPERWNSGPIVIATTHQLMRFQAAFDLIVIDELDAFPFHNNPLLAFAAEKACKTSGKFIYLSATPPLYLERLVNKKQMPFAKVPVRYHRHPLPVPKHIGIGDLQPLLIKQTFPRKLQAALTQSVVRGAQVFVFVPKIKYVEDTVKLLQSIFTELVVAGTSSHDPERAEKVQRFRTGDIRLLVTTTILERGVTVPKTDVFILGAESSLFDSAALVQMSGRAGRSKEDPYGFVYFCTKDRTRAQKKAIHQIVNMNRIARKEGYLIGR
jgi:competence protein ComFA